MWSMEIHPSRLDYRTTLAELKILLFPFRRCLRKYLAKAHCSRSTATIIPTISTTTTEQQHQQHRWYQLLITAGWRTRRCFLTRRRGEVDRDRSDPLGEGVSSNLDETTVLAPGRSQSEGGRTCSSPNRRAEEGEVAARL